MRACFLLLSYRKRLLRTDLSSNYAKALYRLSLMIFLHLSGMSLAALANKPRLTLTRLAKTRLGLLGRTN